MSLHFRHPHTSRPHCPAYRLDRIARPSASLVGLVMGLLALGLTACAGASAPAQVSRAMPPLSLAVPELPGTLVDMADSPAIATLQEAAACLATGQPVYAVVTGTGNVFTAPGEDACILGTVQAGSVVRIHAIQADSDLADEVLFLAALATADDPVPAADWPLGYAEDVQPIFEAICTNCHGVNLQSGGLRVTTYEGIMAGSQYGPVVVPGDPQASKLWSQIHRNIMPLVGELDAVQKATVNAWIAGGALAERPPVQNDTQIWLSIDQADYQAKANRCTQDELPRQVISGDLVRFATCGAVPTAQQVADLLPKPAVAAPAASDQAAAPASTLAAAANVNAPAGQLGLNAGPLGLSAPSEADGWMQAKGGFCVEQRLPQLQDQRGITAMTFADDGRLFLGLDAPTTGEPDPLILFDAFHPSRSILVYDAVNDSGSNEILGGSSRVTGMDHANGVLYLNRAGEVGRIPDGGSYQTLAGGFAVQGRLFHANNGLVVLNGWLYVSAGGVRDGYSDGIINPGSDGSRPAESIALDIATNGNTLAARIVRAPVDQLVQQRSAAVFQTAARGLRNPYGLAADPSGRLWVTDNGATNVAGDYTAGDEVNLFEPARLSGAATAGDETATPFYGFPIALAGNPPSWYTPPVLPLLNASAPTGITWAYGTVFYAQYGRDPGLYRLAVSGGRVVSERILFVWPVQAVATAPDGAIWIGTGSGGLYRITPGCN